MGKKNLKKDGHTVSPVISVLLMAAITVTLAGIVGSVNGLWNGRQHTPDESGGGNGRANELDSNRFHIHGRARYRFSAVSERNHRWKSSRSVIGLPA